MSNVNDFLLVAGWYYILQGTNNHRNLRAIENLVRGPRTVRTDLRRSSKLRPGTTAAQAKFLHGKRNHPVPHHTYADDLNPMNGIYPRYDSIHRLWGKKGTPTLTLSIVEMITRGIGAHLNHPLFVAVHLGVCVVSLNIYSDMDYMGSLMPISTSQ